MLYETSRLRVRYIDNEDYADLLEVYGDAEAMRWVDDRKPITPDHCRRWIEVTLHNYRNIGYGMSAMEDKTTNRVVGFCGVVHPGQQEAPEIKYALRRSDRGAGLTREAVGGMLNYFLSHFTGRPVIATVDPDNLASRRVLEKAGLCLKRTCHDEDGRPTLVYASVNETLVAK